MSRLQAWALGSRLRYALLWGAVNAATVASVSLLARFPEISFERAVPYMTFGFVLAVSAQALIGYPMAKRRLSTRRG